MSTRIAMCLSIGVVDLLFDTRYSPSVRILVFVEQRIDLLTFFELAQLGWIAKFEKRRRKLYQPLWVNGHHFTHILE